METSGRDSVPGHESVIAGPESQGRFIPVVMSVETGPGEGIVTFPDLVSRTENGDTLLFGSPYPRIVAEIGLVGSEEAQVQTAFGGRSEDKIEDRMEGITGTGLQIETASPVGILLRSHVEHVRFEAVRAVIFLLEDLIVVIQVEAQQRIRHRHLRQRLPRIGRGALVGVGNLHGRIEVLRSGARAEENRRYCQ